MFSNDQNIEYIAQFVEEVKRWFDLRTKYTRLTVVDKIVRIITSLILIMAISVILVLFLFFISYAAANFLGKVFESVPLGFLFVGCVYLLMLIIVYNARHVLIERPLVRFLMNILAEDLVEDETPETNTKK
ncbi:MAG: phage holin family protein [Prevotella sp.]|nr:phage holin family protein [Prevotella sp.]